MSDIADVTTIRQLNDHLRQSLAGGVLVMTEGVIALGYTRQLNILQAVAADVAEPSGTDTREIHGELSTSAALQRGFATG